MGILSWVLLGLIVGVIAKFLMPGRDPGGFIVTVLLGIAGASVGGFVSTKLGFGTFNGFDVKSIAIATGGAIIVLFVYRMVMGRK